MSQKTNDKKLPTADQIKTFGMLSPMLDSILAEVKEFSKKKQDGVWNELKVKMVNRVLEQIKEVLSNEPTVDFLDLLDNEILPVNSDAVLIITCDVKAHR